MAEKGARKDKNQNIQVFIRLRPLNQREKDIKSMGVIEVVNNREVVVRQSHQTNITKKFTFDKAFAPNAKQVEVYQDVVSPLITEVLAGYNCTVFAYGQTGTGKTHTMIGESSGDGTTWQNDPLAGIIPRALSQIFDELRLSNTEYTVRVSYLELYNEELFDLLSSSEDNSKLRIYEDVTRKGSNIVHGLEEITVYNKNEVYKIMSQGQERKKVASTLMNAQSSRSHTVFTILIHMKENSAEGEELVKIGKLNLVDLAGSENISKAGSDNPAKKERARECVNINQSLLTLGRVITALVERHPHIPYRESKLTRILQESLGGRTKTSIIATISPGHKDLEETMSTLEYANRAKNIQNKPEVNQKMTKIAILKEYSEEIDRLKRDLQASRDKNGIYLANETYTELTVKQDEQRKEIQELILQKRAVEEEKDRMEKLFGDLNSQLSQKEVLLETTKKTLDTTATTLNATRTALSEQRHLVSRQSSTAGRLTAQATHLLQTADAATGDVAKLVDAYERRRSVESRNQEATRAYRELSHQTRARIQDDLHKLTTSLETTVANVTADIESHCEKSVMSQQQNVQIIDELIQKFAQVNTEIKAQTSVTERSVGEQTCKQREMIQSVVRARSSQLAASLGSLSAATAVTAVAASAAAVDHREYILNYIEEWTSRGSDRVRSLREERAGREMNLRRRRDMLRLQLEQITAHKETIETNLLKQLSELESEIRNSEDQLQSWIDEEKRMFNERIAKFSEHHRRITRERVEVQTREINETIGVLTELTESLNKLREDHSAQTQEDAEWESIAVQESQRADDDDELDLQQCHGVFDENSLCLRREMSSLCRDVQTRLDQLQQDVDEAIGGATTKTQEVVSAAVSCDRESSEQMSQVMREVFDHVIEGVSAVLAHTTDYVESTSESCCASLQQVSSCCNTTSLSEREHQSLVSAALQQATDNLASRATEIQQGLHHLHAIQGNYLAKEYVVYKPTGETPSRPEYSYPRSLVEFSPHQRVLAKFRAMRETNNDDDCILVESDNEDKSPSRSDSETSVSEDSALFAAPSPPVHTAHTTHAGHTTHTAPPLAKCNSETNIYTIKKHEKGKENERTIQSHKKPSKLPAPQSHHRPLADRNAAS